ncbi:MAG: hypothetical protein IJQ12_01335 [Lachnospiraceae bacterium]|nr:hypothetical protein [Lachnospiraceae bacterium]
MSFSPPAAAFLILFLAASAVHLYHSYLDDAGKRAYTKPFLLLFLILFYVSAAGTRNHALLLALACAWAGDVLLIFPGNRFFVLGGIAFLFAHFFLMAAFVPGILAVRVEGILLAGAAIAYLLATAWIIRRLFGIVPKKMLVPMCLYLAANGTTNLFALMQLMTLRNTGAFLAFLGAFFFFFSDCVLYLVRYHPDRNLIYKRHFTVMAAYLAGVFLITLGMLQISEIIS